MDNQNNEAHDLIVKAREALRRGDKETAHSLGEQAALLAPGMEDAWLVLTASDPNPEDALAYAQQALEINPSSERARKAVEWSIARMKQAQTAPEVAVAATAAAVAAEPEDLQETKKSTNRTWLYVVGAILGLLLCVVAALMIYQSVIRPNFASFINSSGLNKVTEPSQENNWAPMRLAKPSLTHLSRTARLRCSQRIHRLLHLTRSSQHPHPPRSRLHSDPLNHPLRRPPNHPLLRRRNRPLLLPLNYLLPLSVKRPLPRQQKRPHLRARRSSHRCGSRLAGIYGNTWRHHHGDRRRHANKRGRSALLLCTAAGGCHKWKRLALDRCRPHQPDGVCLSRRYGCQQLSGFYRYLADPNRHGPVQDLCEISFRTHVRSWILSARCALYHVFLWGLWPAWYLLA